MELLLIQWKDRRKVCHVAQHANLEIQDKDVNHVHSEYWQAIIPVRPVSMQQEEVGNDENEGDQNAAK